MSKTETPAHRIINEFTTETGNGRIEEDLLVDKLEEAGYEAEYEINKALQIDIEDATEFDDNCIYYASI